MTQSVPPPSGPAAARPAATVVVVRESPAGPEVYLVRRHAAIAFMGGAHVFPGGRVDEGDRLLAADPRLCPHGPELGRSLPGVDGLEAMAYYVAALRELFEEAGVLLARRGDDIVRIDTPEMEAAAADARLALHDRRVSFATLLDAFEVTLAPDLLVPLSHWVTPAAESRRFDTRFFVARSPSAQQALHDAREVTEGLWATPRDALGLASRREVLLPPPTLRTLQELAPCDTIEAIVAYARASQYRRLEPVLVHDGQRRMLVMPGDPLYPTPDVAVHEETRFVHDDGYWVSARA